MRRVVYTSVTVSGPSRNAYRDSTQLVLRQGAQLPDICIRCGNRAWGNVLHKDLPDHTIWIIVLPPPVDIIVDPLLRRHYRFEFPFCPNCPPEQSCLSPRRLDGYLAVFGVVSRAFLDSAAPDATGRGGGEKPHLDSAKIPLAVSLETKPGRFGFRPWRGRTIRPLQGRKNSYHRRPHP